MIFEKELRYYESRKDELLKFYENKFALIKGEPLIDTFTTIEEAYVDGIKRFGSDIFLIRKISNGRPDTILPPSKLETTNAGL